MPSFYAICFIYYFQYWCNSVCCTRCSRENIYFLRSEERRVGKECRSGWTAEHYKKTQQRRMLYTNYVQRVAVERAVKYRYADEVNDRREAISTGERQVIMGNQFSIIVGAAGELPNM